MLKKILNRIVFRIKLLRTEWWRDPRIPSWWWDDRVWKYLKKNYGLEPGGIIDDQDGPPLLIIESIKSDFAD